MHRADGKARRAGEEEDSGAFWKAWGALPSQVGRGRVGGVRWAGLG